MPEWLNWPISHPFMTGRLVGAITLASAALQHHKALSKLVNTRVHGFSTSTYTWDLGPEL